MTCYDKMLRSWVWLQSKILLWEISYLLPSLPFFSVSQPPHWQWIIFVLQRFCLLIVFALTNQLELVGLWHWRQRTFHCMIPTEGPLSTQDQKLQTEVLRLVDWLERTEENMNLFISLICKERSVWLMVTRRPVLGAVTLASNDQRCINSFSLLQTQMITIRIRSRDWRRVVPRTVWCVTVMSVVGALITDRPGAGRGKGCCLLHNDLLATSHCPLPATGTRHYWRIQPEWGSSLLTRKYGNILHEIRIWLKLALGLPGAGGCVIVNIKNLRIMESVKMVRSVRRGGWKGGGRSVNILVPGPCPPLV